MLLSKYGKNLKYMLINFLGIKTTAYGIFIISVISPKEKKKGAAE